MGPPNGGKEEGILIPPYGRVERALPRRDFGPIAEPLSGLPWGLTRWVERQTRDEVTRGTHG